MNYYEQIKGETANSYSYHTRAEIERIKKRITSEKLLAYKNDMEDIFAAPLETVCTPKKNSPSHNLHDYISLGTYWWSNPETKDGVPYIRRDGEANPEGALYDKHKFKRLAHLTYNCALLYFLTDEARYLDLIHKHLYHWFIAEETYMTPHLEHGQFIPGVCNGRAAGIIDYGSGFAYALNMLSLLKAENLLEPDLQEGLLAWHRDFRTWLLYSNIGKDERAAKNNHSIFYDFILCVIEQFLGMESEIQKRAETFIQDRIEKQVAPDFSLPHEMARTRSVSYSIMAVKGLLHLANIYRNLTPPLSAIDFYPRIKGCVDWIYRDIIAGRASWQYAQITPFDEGVLLLFRNLATTAYTAAYGDAYQNIIDFVDNKKIIYKVLEYLYG
jgi:hypothetical protein